MFTGITTHACSLATAIVVLTGAAILRGGAASADPNQDDQFLALLSQQGIPAVSGIPDLIKTAHEVCRELNSGVPTGAVANQFEDFANTVTPGADPRRLHRTAIRFVRASAGAYCPNHQVGYRRGYRVILAGANVENPLPPLPQVPDAQTLKPRQAAVPAAPKKAPPVVGPPPGSGGGGGGNGGGTGGGGSHDGPGIVTLAP
jgi:hypothetical protein